MGQPVTVIEKQLSEPGVMRYELNRVLTGTEHVRYNSIADAQGVRPPDRLARMLFEHGGIKAIHMNANVVTVYLADGSPPKGIKELIEDMYVFYKPGVVPELPEGVEL